MLVYEFMRNGSLADHLYGKVTNPFSKYARSDPLVKDVAGLN